jgi:hypothetical protein
MGPRTCLSVFARQFSNTHGRGVSRVAEIDTTGAVRGLGDLRAMAARTAQALS